MTKSLLRGASVLLTAVMLFALAALAPIGVSATDTGMTIHATSNIFQNSDITVSDWTAYENENNDAFVTVDFKLCAADKYLIGIELDELTWNKNVLEFKEAYNMVGTGRNAVSTIFPFGYSRGCGTGTVNTFGDTNYGRLVGNYSSVQPAAYASEEDGSPITAVRATFKVLDKTATETTVNCSVETLSLCDSSNNKPYAQYIPVLAKNVNENAGDWAVYTSNASANYPKPYIKGKSLTVGSGGEIGVYFYVTVKDPDYDKSRLTASFEWGSGVYETKIENSELISKNNRDYFLVYVPSLCMTDTITLSMFEDNNKLLAAEYSVKQYIIDYTNTDYMVVDPEVKVLCDMLDYGGTAQLQFGYNTEDLASNYINLLNPSWTRTITEDNLTDNSNLDNLDASYGLAYDNCTMSVSAKIKVNIYFTVNDPTAASHTSAYLGSEKVPFTVDKKGRKCLTLTGFEADKIFDATAITFKNGDNSNVMYFSAAKYFNKIKNSDSYPQPLKDVMQAMNNFVNSTVEYVS